MNQRSPFNIYFIPVAHKSTYMSANIHARFGLAGWLLYGNKDVERELSVHKDHAS